MDFRFCHYIQTDIVTTVGSVPSGGKGEKMQQNQNGSKVSFRRELSGKQNKTKIEYIVEASSCRSGG